MMDITDDFRAMWSAAKELAEGECCSAADCQRYLTPFCLEGECWWGKLRAAIDRCAPLFDGDTDA